MTAGAVAVEPIRIGSIDAGSPRASVTAPQPRAAPARPAHTGVESAHAD